VYELQEMQDELDAHYILMNDIDAIETREWNVGDHDGNPETPDSAMGFEPVGKYSKENTKFGFAGEFFGQGFTINELYINRPFEDNVGLFGCVTVSKNINNVHIASSNVVGRNFVGIFVGQIYAGFDSSEILIKECSSDGSVYGRECIGGFCGLIYLFSKDVSIINSFSSGTVIGKHRTGGFCGYNFSIVGDIYIINSHSICSVSGSGVTGGFIGENHAYGSWSSINIINSYSSGSVSGSGVTGGFIGTNFAYENDAVVSIEKSFASGATSGSSYVGGFCGYNFSEYGTARIDCSYSIGETKGQIVYIGGFCGKNYSPYAGKASITNSYATGNVIDTDTNNKYIGGIGGFFGCNETKGPLSSNRSKIERCYCIGKVIGFKNVGGFCGIQHYLKDINNCYWDTHTSGTTESDGGTPKTTSEMMMQSTFENWDFDEVWCIGEHETYPQLQHFVDCDTLVSVPQREMNSEIILYPHPVKDILTLEYSVGTPGFVRISVYDINGVEQLIIPDKFHLEGEYSIDINTSDFKSGTYLIEIESASGISTKQVMVIK
jgi:hypothetical protein